MKRRASAIRAFSASDARFGSPQADMRRRKSPAAMRAGGLNAGSRGLKIVANFTSSDSGNGLTHRHIQRPKWRVVDAAVKRLGIDI